MFFVLAINLYLDSPNRQNLFLANFSRCTVLSLKVLENSVLQEGHVIWVSMFVSDPTILRGNLIHLSIMIAST